MRTIQMTLDDELVERVDEIVREQKTTRSAFTRKALRDAIERARVRAGVGRKAPPGVCAAPG